MLDAINKRKQCLLSVLIYLILLPPTFDSLADDEANEDKNPMSLEQVVRHWDQGECRGGNGHFSFSLKSYRRGPRYHRGYETYGILRIDLGDEELVYSGPELFQWWFDDKPEDCVLMLSGNLLILRGYEKLGKEVYINAINMRERSKTTYWYNTYGDDLTYAGELSEGIYLIAGIDFFDVSHKDAEYTYRSPTCPYNYDAGNSLHRYISETEEKYKKIRHFYVEPYLSGYGFLYYGNRSFKYRVLCDQCSAMGSTNNPLIRKVLKAHFESLFDIIRYRHGDIDMQNSNNDKIKEFYRALLLMSGLFFLEPEMRKAMRIDEQLQTFIKDDDPQILSAFREYWRLRCE